MLGQLSKKSDVYSFGVLVLELVSGRSSSKAAFGEDLLVLVEWVSCNHAEPLLFLKTAIEMLFISISYCAFHLIDKSVVMLVAESVQGVLLE